MLTCMSKGHHSDLSYSIVFCACYQKPLDGRIHEGHALTVYGEQTVVMANAQLQLTYKNKRKKQVNIRKKEDDFMKIRRKMGKIQGNQTMYEAIDWQSSTIELREAATYNGSYWK